MRCFSSIRAVANSPSARRETALATDMSYVHFYFQSSPVVLVALIALVLIGCSSSSRSAISGGSQSAKEAQAKGQGLGKLVVGEVTGRGATYIDDRQQQSSLAKIKEANHLNPGRAGLDQAQLLHPAVMLRGAKSRVAEAITGNGSGEGSNNEVTAAESGSPESGLPRPTGLEQQSPSRQRQGIPNQRETSVGAGAQKETIALGKVEHSDRSTGRGDYSKLDDTENSRDWSMERSAAYERPLRSPAVPFYLPGTQEAGVMKLNTALSDRGEKRYSLEFVDGVGSNNDPRDRITLTRGDIAELQRGLSKLHQWSARAQAEKVRKVYSKKAACFTVASCSVPAQGVSAKLNFQIYENGATGGQIVVCKGRYEQPYNFSIDSLAVLRRYLTSSAR
jgi:hypothetical protein